MVEIKDYTDFQSVLNSSYESFETIDEFQKLFDSIAKYVLSNLVIKVGNTTYIPVEIELYYRNSKVDKKESFKRTYNRDCQAGELFLHYSGLDICFVSDKNTKCCGGILIRSLIKPTQQEQKVIPGPLRCANELLNNCFKQKTLPKISVEKNDIKKGIYKTIRQGIETGEKFEQIRKDYFTHRKHTSQILPLFAYYIEGTDWPNDYSANPSINYKKDKTETRGKYSKPI
jgi:hypothetical protein